MEQLGEVAYHHHRHHHHHQGHHLLLLLILIVSITMMSAGELLRLQRERLGEGHPEVLWTMEQLGEVWADDVAHLPAGAREKHRQLW
jgi:hypothetical protein